MNLREYQAKNIFSQHGITIPIGKITTTPEETAKAASELNSQVVIKPQLGVKGRGKAGGIGFAPDPAAALQEAERLLSLTIKGETVEKLLVEEKIDIADELYIAVTVDYSIRHPVLIASSEGGVEIEETAKTHPERVFRIPVNILTGPTPDDFTTIADQLGQDTAQYLEILYRIFRQYDAELVEINPLVRTKQGNLCAVDAVLNINEDSVFRHEELADFKKEIPVVDPISEEASRSSWTYIDLPGDIGILSSGAGLTMAILDLIHKAKGKPANFLDTAQIDDEGIYNAFDLLSRAKKTRVLLVNMFAGLNRCDNLALGIQRYLNDHPMEIPIVVRMIGNREEEGHRILREIGIEPFTRLEDAIEHAVKLSKEAEV
ncbi:MAG: succinate--CoA ligase subunit beta [Candidatus Aminicenantes bacterium]|nr:succinate--CoA ligase subunit beta [Candidatus Aminicenantes bacterium]NIM81349.1 succinate--CoA ligase subunit beta [Candidatus Aminicenantes bacterium]NIN20760.1 succinate--CoA ligase subunit beta [Candidatus Aminicenantes bacterium]NIN44538.1 succinate--CoA ligase subunit beta [Candidatus Aminicenantes bacterium]NIN87358.1 succinate--CoA ligase subunit beta [Candidatus Aminicenantes bacterium]